MKCYKYGFRGLQFNGAGILFKKLLGTNTLAYFRRSVFAKKKGFMKR
jgi:hypothetical protein